MNDMEARRSGPCVRSFDITDFEFRDEGSTGFIFEGVASVVDRPYPVRDAIGTFTETIRAGAFTKTLKDGKADVGLFVNHDYRSLPLATRLDGSLRLSADPDLRVRAVLDPDRPSVQEVRSAVKGGQARQMSIGFTVPTARDKWNDDMTERQISEVALSEASIVWRGANPYTSGAMRTADLIAALTLEDMDEADIRRAVAHLRSLLPDAVSPVEPVTLSYLNSVRAGESWTSTATTGAANGTLTLTVSDTSARPTVTTDSRQPGPIVGPELLALWDRRKSAP